MPSSEQRESRGVAAAHSGHPARARLSQRRLSYPGGVSVVLFACMNAALFAARANAGCSGMASCVANTHCARCLEAINATVGLNHTIAEWTYNVDFFQDLQSTVSCSTNATPPDLLEPALRELYMEASCIDAYGMSVSFCLIAEYNCFVDPDCRQCLAALYAAAADNGSNGTKTSALRSPACIAAASSDLIIPLNNNCVETFPTCTYNKLQCVSLPECESCLAALSAGDGAGAARQCRTSISQAASPLDNVVNHCVASDTAACGFWRQRCKDNADCDACLAAMGSGDSFSAIVAGWSVLACQRAVLDEDATFYLYQITRACLDTSTCRRVVTACILHYEYADQCLACINGSAILPDQAALCSHISQEYSFDTACQPCPTSVHTINSVVFATAGVGGASAAVCIVVATTIVAHGRDRVSMRDRIVVGLMMANAVYSTANAIPLNALRTGVLDCGRLAMSYDAIRLGRAWWFCGKYGLVGFELFILGASIRALHRGMSRVPKRVEMTLHLACCALASLAFAVFYTMCARINAGGYNINVETEAFTDAFHHARADDDLDDDRPSTAASLVFQSGRSAYDNLVRDMLVAWDAVVGVAVGMWVVLRAVHLYALRALRTEAAAAARAEAMDEWGDTRRSQWDARHRMLEARRQGFNEVAKPLEPYIFVFLVFAAPAFVMSTPFCQNHSGASAIAGDDSIGEGTGDSVIFTYGMCDVWCEFVLAFRSLGTVAVYLASHERRAEFVAIRSTWRKLCTRVAECIRCTPLPYAPLGHAHGGKVEMGAWALQSADNINNDSTAATATSAADASSCLMKEFDIIKERVLGQGAFGQVLAGTLKSDGRRVAIKILFGGVLDDDGDLVDPNADEDFHKECAALQRVDSPHLIKFFGYGTTTEGNGFIVTELVSGGSLEDVLHNPQRDLPWPTRVKIALQVALGMEHIHKRHMLHRDLKSANVLLDEELKAKVCDFGLSRVVKPARQHVEYWPFTGVVRLLPSAAGIEINHGRFAPSSKHISVTILGVNGNMTKAAGTLQWMAPEVFRGDQNYTKAVDVYSFGIVLWELATRMTPWMDTEGDDSETVLFNRLNHALKSGQRPLIPDCVLAEHGAFASVMQRCWAGDPIDRQTFSVAVSELAECVRSY